MTKKPAANKTPLPASRQTEDFASLIIEVRELVQAARHAAASTVNTLQVLTNFEIGRRIVEHEQKGENRAGYGQELMKVLSSRLTDEFGKGFSKANIEYMRRFYLAYQNHYRIAQTVTGQLCGTEVNHEISDGSQIAQSPTGQFPVPRNRALSVFTLSWTHYVLLLGIEDENERSFYEIESSREGWSVRELKRQVNSCLYERLALSRDKKGVRKLAMEGQIVTSPVDILKEPYVLEFLGLDERASYTESDLEQAIIDRIEHFLLELGKGFLFEARQRRFTFDEDHFFVDLVFYNRLLRCYVLVDLKLDKLTHQDLGQMQMYVNFFDREVKLQEENPTIGILLCKRKKDAIVELTLPVDANIHAKEYKLYLPSKELLRKKLIEWARQEEGNVR